MIYLRSLATQPGEPGAYPLNKPQLLGAHLTFDAPVTLLSGDNGSGKSTLMEALARKLRLPSIGAQDAASDPTLGKLTALERRMKLVFGLRHRNGFFLRAEDFFGFAHRIESLKSEMRAELQRVEEEYRDRSEYTKGYARMAYAGSLMAMEARYGEGLDAASHGESFIKLFQARMSGPGLYLLDEPEAPLSPMRLLSLISLIREREADSQFIIATHSPMLLSYPGARIYLMDADPIRPVRYEELESVRLIKDFLAAPERYLKHL